MPSQVPIHSAPLNVDSVRSTDYKGLEVGHADRQPTIERLVEMSSSAAGAFV